MVLINCPSAGCYWTADVGATVEQASASFVVHWRAKHEPLAQSPIDPGASPDLLPINQPEPPVTKPKTSRPAVSVVRRNYLASEQPETDDRGLTSGGTPPEEFWSRPDEYKGAMKRTRKLPMGRPLR